MSSTNAVEVRWQSAKSHRAPPCPAGFHEEVTRTARQAENPPARGRADQHDTPCRFDQNQLGCAQARRSPPLAIPAAHVQLRVLPPWSPC